MFREYKRREMCFGGETYRKQVNWKKLRCRWEDNIKINLQETKWGLVDWIHLAQDKEAWRSFVNIVINIQVPYIANNILIL